MMTLLQGDLRNFSAPPLIKFLSYLYEPDLKGDERRREFVLAFSARLITHLENDESNFNAAQIYDIQRIVDEYGGLTKLAMAPSTVSLFAKLCSSRQAMMDAQHMVGYLLSTHAIKGQLQGGASVNKAAFLTAMKDDRGGIIKRTEIIKNWSRYKPAAGLLLCMMIFPKTELTPLRQLVHDTGSEEEFVSRLASFQINWASLASYYKWSSTKLQALGTTSAKLFPPGKLWRFSVVPRWPDPDSKLEPLLSAEQELLKTYKAPKQL